MRKGLKRKLHLTAVYLLVVFLEVFAVFYLPLRGVWRGVWGTWARFWCAVRLWRYLGYRWRAAWRTASYVLEDTL